MAGVAPGNDLRLAPPSDVEIQTELAKLFPDVAMQISSDVERGPQGPFGYAAGKSGGLNCVYAWQYLSPRRPLTLLEGASGTGVYPASVRVRLCRAEPLANLLADMHRLTVTPPGSFGVTARLPRAPDPVREDALEAAVGPLERVPVETPTVERRAGRHVHLARISSRRQRLARPRRARGLDDTAGGRSTVPPVPLPGDLATGAAAPAPVARSAVATAPRLDQDSMPLPK